MKQKKKSDRMELKQLRTAEMGNTQINPPIVPAPAPKRNALDDLAQYASDDEYEEADTSVWRGRGEFKRARIRAMNLSLKKANIPLKNYGHRRRTNLL